MRVGEEEEEIVKKKVGHRQQIITSKDSQRDVGYVKVEEQLKVTRKHNSTGYESIHKKLIIQQVYELNDVMILVDDIVTCAVSINPRTAIILNTRR